MHFNIPPRAFRMFIANQGFCAAPFRLSVISLCALLVACDQVVTWLSGSQVTVQDGHTGVVYESVVDVGVSTDDVIYALHGDDKAHFNFNRRTGVLTFTNPPSYTSPLDANSDNQYELILGASLAEQFEVIYYLDVYVAEREVAQ